MSQRANWCILAHTHTHWLTHSHAHTRSLTHTHCEKGSKQKKSRTFSFLGGKLFELENSGWANGRRWLASQVMEESEGWSEDKVTSAQPNLLLLMPLKSTHLRIYVNHHFTIWITNKKHRTQRQCPSTSSVVICALIHPNCFVLHLLIPAPSWQKSLSWSALLGSALIWSDLIWSTVGVWSRLLRAPDPRGAVLGGQRLAGAHAVIGRASNPAHRRLLLCRPQQHLLADVDQQR